MAATLFVSQYDTFKYRTVKKKAKPEQASLTINNKLGEKTVTLLLFSPKCVIDIPFSLLLSMVFS